LEAFYERDGATFLPSELTRGPWDPRTQHAGPPAGLLGRAVQADDTLIGRIAIDLLRPVPIAPLVVMSSVVRPGRNVELLEAVMSEPAPGSRPVARALAWRLRIDEGVAALPSGPQPPGPDEGSERPFFPTGQERGYHTAMDYRFVDGAFTEPGPARVWMRMRRPLVAGEPTSALSRVLVAADSGNGVSATLDYRRHVFINTDLTVHLVREPAGEWVLLDATTYVGPHGVGLSESVLHDEAGRLGRASQTLLVRLR